MGPEATEANKRLVESKTVLLEKDVSETDRYGRLLRYVYMGDIFVNEELVKQGYAQASMYPPDVKYADLFIAAQREARAAERGLWSAVPTPSPTLTATPQIMWTPPTRQPREQFFCPGVCPGGSWTEYATPTPVPSPTQP
jgi:endonuclease YncB( thermonuclease family)